MTDAFAERAAQWDANPVRAAVGNAIYQEVLRECPDLSGRTVLEFGCGTGVLGLRLALEHLARLIFVDTSPAMLDVLRQKLEADPLPGAQVLEGDIASLPLDAASVDLVACGMSLHHVEDVPGVLRQLRRVLRPGGLLLAADALPEDGSFHAPAAVPHNGFDPLELSRTLADCGFSARPHRVFHILPKPDATGALRQYPLFFLRAEAL